MVFRNCLGMIASVSMLIIGMGAATPVSVVNLSIASSAFGSAAGSVRDRLEVRAPLNASGRAPVKEPIRAGWRGRPSTCAGVPGDAGFGSWPSARERARLGAFFRPAGARALGGTGRVTLFQRTAQPLGLLDVTVRIALAHQFAAMRA